jgi:hypothetical protein
VVIAAVALPATIVLDRSVTCPKDVALNLETPLPIFAPVKPVKEPLVANPAASVVPPEAKAIATSLAATLPLAVIVNPPNVIESKLAIAENVTEAVSTAWVGAAPAARPAKA